MNRPMGVPPDRDPPEYPRPMGVFTAGHKPPVRYCTEFSGEILNEPVATSELIKSAQVVARQDSRGIVVLISRDELDLLKAKADGREK